MKKPLLVPILAVATLIVFGIIITVYTMTKSSPVSNEGTLERPENISNLLVSQFPLTDWSKANPSLENAVSGGPKRDGIPALTDPKFIPIQQFEGSNLTQVIVLERSDEVRVYPYNILTWHEIINDTVGGVPVAVTFCPLCGSAIVFNRTLPNGTVSTFGVSGFLLESNMLMFDKMTESLWQQSTGVGLAGTYFDKKLQRESFQLMTLGSVKSSYPEALIVSKETGYERDYDRNPYAGYETDNRFVFEPSSIDSRFPPKTIMTLFQAENTLIAIPWVTLREKDEHIITIVNTEYILTLAPDGELTIKRKENAELIPFYFEMWFSAAAQHGDSLLVIEPS